jgi:SAM-dependent methyltransferase
LVPARGHVLDVAAGRGRHSRLFLERGHRVLAVDVATSSLEPLRRLIELGQIAGHLDVLEADLEDGRPFPLQGRRFDGVVVTNYLHRPILADLVDAVAPGGVLIYETFARGHERFGRPSRTDFLLQPGELLEAVRGSMRVVAYEDLLMGDPPRAAVQRICATRPR